METGKLGLVSASAHINSVAAQTEKRMDVQAPLTAVYIHTVPALPAQPYSHSPAAAREPATLHLAMPPLYSKEMLPFLTLHIAGGLQSQPGLSLAAAASNAARPKSAGKHVCPHCGRDCMKPSVLEKHLRCHTGERPYPCTTCGISFKTQSNLYKHKRTQAHARLSSESEQSSMSSLDSVSSCKELQTSSLSLDERSDVSGCVEKESTLPTAEITCATSTTKVFTTKMHSSAREQNEFTHVNQETKETSLSGKISTEGEKQRTEKEKSQPGRHLPLQRQEATLFSKQWESSVTREKSQNHESTDSGFSESSDHYPSPGGILPEHSMDSLTETTKEHLEESTSIETQPEQDHIGQEAKDCARVQEQKSLEERISKLISENTAVVEDRQLENVRPRKTVLSKQGSIDLPMPYTYKDSFHFDMRISKTPNVGLQRNRKPGLYNSVPSQHSTTTDHAPLTRSNSLPFSVTLLRPENNNSPTTSSSSSSYHSDYVTLVRRGSSGQINPSGFAIKPVNQQSSTHRPLVRQTAVDCNHATDGLFTNLSVEEAAGGSLSFDSDICGEPSNKKFRRKKAQKFAYNKWYMYGGGTFKKLYGTEKCGDDSAVKGRKCSTNLEPEVVQGIQKRTSEVHKDTVVTTCSTVNLTTSSATVCHFDSLPAKLSLVPAVDFNIKTNQLHTSCSSVKTPLQRNLSLSVLPFPLIGSLIGHTEDNMSRPKDGKLINEDKHNDSSSQLCGAHVPSDRKKQKTDNKTICPLEMDTDANTLTHSALSVTGSAQLQVPNLTYINIQKNLQHSQLTGTLVPPCIINANPSSVSTSPATHAIAKTSFLPKYQLKLPSATEPAANASLHVVDKLSGADGGSFASALSSAITTATNKCSDVTSSPLNQNPNPPQSCDTKKTNDFASTQSQHLLPCIATTLSEAGIASVNKNATSSLPVVHRQLAGTTITTTCLQDNQVRLCSTSVQQSKHMWSPTPIQQPRLVANFPATSAVTTANTYQASAATITPFSPNQPNPNLPQSHMQLSRASAQLSPVNRTYASPSTSVVPCHIVPFTQMQSAVQNVFHVHTADLQICLQIISDEQLALIEPQIERQAGNNVSDKPGTEAGAPDMIQKTAQASVDMEGSTEGTDHQQPGHHKGTDQSESSFAHNEERKKSEGNNSTQAIETAEHTPPEAAVSSPHPHKSSHVSTVTETQSLMAEVMSTAASLKGVKSDQGLASEDCALFLNRFSEDQVLLGGRVGQGGLVSEMLPGQHKLSRNSLSPCTVNQNSTQGNAQGSESQHKLKNQGTAYDVGTAKVSVCKGSESESIESYFPSQSQASGAACAHKLSASVSQFPIKKCKALRELNPQASIHCSGPVDSMPSEVLSSSKHENMGCDPVTPVDDSVSSQEMALSESQDVISTVHSGNQMSPCVQVERPKDIPAVLSRVQSPTAGNNTTYTSPENTGGDFLAGCAAQTETRTQGHAGTCGQLGRSGWSPRHSQEARETNHKCMEAQAEEVERGYKDGGIMSAEEQWGSADSDGQYVSFQDGTQPEGEDRKTKVDLSKWSEQQLQHPSQTQSRMSEYPEESPQHAPSTSNNPNLPVSSSQTSLFNSPQAPFEMTNFYYSQQHWESNIVHKQQTQLSCDSSSGQHIKEMQNAFAQIESCPQQTQTFSLQNQNITTVTGCTNSNLGSLKSLFPDVITLSSTGPSQVSHSIQNSGVATGLTGQFQASNNSVLDNNKLSSNPFTHPQIDQDTTDKPPGDLTSHSGSFGRMDFTNKYQSFIFASPLQGYQPAECIPSGVRPVQSCQDYTEDTSSSDDEGKLIIEL